MYAQRLLPSSVWATHYVNKLIFPLLFVVETPFCILGTVTSIRLRNVVASTQHTAVSKIKFIRVSNYYSASSPCGLVVQVQGLREDDGIWQCVVGGNLSTYYLTGVTKKPQ